MIESLKFPKILLLNGVQILDAFRTSSAEKRLLNIVRRNNEIHVETKLFKLDKGALIVCSCLDDQRYWAIIYL